MIRTSWKIAVACCLACSFPAQELLRAASEAGEGFRTEVEVEVEDVLAEEVVAAVVVVVVDILAAEVVAGIPAAVEVVVRVPVVEEAEAEADVLRGGVVAVVPHMWPRLGHRPEAEVAAADSPQRVAAVVSPWQAVVVDNLQVAEVVVVDNPREVAVVDMLREVGAAPRIFPQAVDALRPAIARRP